MHGLYSDQLARLGVAYYYNQFYAKSADIDFLKSIDFNTFAKGAVVEFHGCRTAEVVPILNTWVKDNFAQDFSSRLGDKGIVIGHITNSSPDKNPNRNVNDYRYGKVRVYNNGTLTQDGVERWGLKLEHSSTP